MDARRSRRNKKKKKNPDSVEEEPNIDRLRNVQYLKYSRVQGKELWTETEREGTYFILTK